MRPYRYYLLVSLVFSILVTTVFRDPSVGFATPFLFFWGLTFISLLVERQRQKIIRQCQVAEVESHGAVSDEALREGAARSTRRLKERADALRQEQE